MRSTCSPTPLEHAPDLACQDRAIGQARIAGRAASANNFGQLGVERHSAAADGRKNGVSRMAETEHDRSRTVPGRDGLGTLVIFMSVVFHVIKF